MNRIGSLCSGYEGLGMAVQSVLGGELAWVADNDPGSAKILAHRFPSTPNLGDITAVDWSAVEPVDVLTAGFPCQDVSCAGARKGLRAGNRTGVWAHVAQAIGVLRPSLVLLENVRGLLSAGADSNMERCPWCLGETGDEHALRASGAVLGDLADLGFDAEWATVSAADAGAPHRRERVFIVARPAADASGRELQRRRIPGDLGGAERTAAGTRDQWERDGDATGGRGPVAEDADCPASGERRITGPGEAEGGRSWTNAGRPGGAPAPANPGGEGLEVRAVELDWHERQAAKRDRGNAPADSERDRLQGERVDPGPRAGRQDAPAGRRGPARGGSAPADAAMRRRDDRIQHAVEPGPAGTGLQATGDAGGGDLPPADADSSGRRPGEHGLSTRERDADRVTPAGADGRRWRPEPGQQRGIRPAEREPGDIPWGAYEPAIRRWEHATGRRAPAPTEPGRTGERLSPRFVEWLMGLPVGWVTDVPGLSRNAQLKALGNGVVPQQAAMALRMLLARAWPLEHMTTEGAA